MLIALSTASRVFSMTNLNIHYMTKNKGKYIFYFDKLHKNTRKIKMPVMYHAFKHNQNCVAHYLTGIYSKDTSPKKS